MIIEKDLVTELARGLKENTALGNIRFVKAYNGIPGEAPLEDMLVTVSSGERSSNSFFGDYIFDGTRGFDVRSELVLNVYCPCYMGGEGITNVVNAIVSRVPSLDLSRLITDINVSSIKISNDYEAIYRTVRLSLRYLSSGGAPDEQ